MPTLHTVTEDTKKTAKWGALGLIGIIVLFFVVRIGVGLRENFFPTPPPPPTVSFGKLPPLVFPKNAADKKLTYIVNTITGGLPILTATASVYPIEKPQPNLLNLKRAQERAATVKFENQPEPLSDPWYVWSEQIPPFRKLILNIVSSNFTITSNFLNDPDSILINTNAPDAASSQTAAISFLSKLITFPRDIDVTKTKTTLLAIENQQIVEASSPSTAHLVRVDFFQKNVDGLPIYYPRPPQSTMHLTLTGGRFNEQVVEANFNHFNIEITSATYPIKTAEEAFKKLQEGNGYIASYFGEENTMSIKKVFLAYYLGSSPTNDKDIPQSYLMPIFVFEGENGFFAYVSAITDAWIETEHSQK